MLVEPRAEGFLQAQEQFDALQAAEAQIAIEMRGCAGRANRRFVPQFGGKLAHDIQHAFFISCRVEVPCGRHHLEVPLDTASGLEGLYMQKANTRTKGVQWFARREISTLSDRESAGSSWVGRTKATGWKRLRKKFSCCHPEQSEGSAFPQN